MYVLRSIGRVLSAGLPHLSHARPKKPFIGSTARGQVPEDELPCNSPPCTSSNLCCLPCTASYSLPSDYSRMVVVGVPHWHRWARANTYHATLMLARSPLRKERRYERPLRGTNHIASKFDWSAPAKPDGNGQPITVPCSCPCKAKKPFSVTLFHPSLTRLQKHFRTLALDRSAITNQTSQPPATSFLISHSLRIQSKTSRGCFRHRFRHHIGSEIERVTTSTQCLPAESGGAEWAARRSEGGTNVSLGIWNVFNRPRCGDQSHQKIDC